MTVYLVENTEEVNEITILDICTDLEVAKKLRKQYICNFIDNFEMDATDMIIIEELEIVPNSEKAIWSYDV